MMRQIVMPASHADFRIPPIAAVVRKHQRRDPRRIRLKRERDHIEHHLHPLAESVGHALGHLQSLLGISTACSNLTIRCSISRNARQILVQLLAVLRAQLAAERARILANEVQDRAIRLLPSAMFLRRSSAVPPPNNRSNTQPRIRLGRHRRRRRPPRNVVLVRTRVTAVAIARAALGVARQFEATETESDAQCAAPPPDRSTGQRGYRPRTFSSPGNR